MDITDQRASEALLSIEDYKGKSILSRSESFVHTETVHKAAYLVDQALLMRWMPLEVLQHENYPRAKLCWSLYNRLFVVRCFALGILTLLPFFQVPHWCTGPKEKPCGDPDRYLLSRIPYIEPSSGLFIELVCVLPLIISLILQREFKFRTFWRRGTAYAKVALVTLLSIRIVSSITGQKWLFFYRGNLVAMYIYALAPIFFCSSVRGCFRMAIQVVHSFIDTAALLGAFVLVSAWFANLLFNGPNFQDYPTSLLSLFIMLTTANNPNVWAGVYAADRVSFCFFFVYMIVGFFFLMQLLFALIYNSYKVQLALEAHRHAALRQKRLRAAYDVMDVTRDGIPVLTATALFHEIASYRNISDVEIILEKVFEHLNRRPDDKIIFGDFQVLCNAFVEVVEKTAESAEELDDEEEVRTMRKNWAMILVESRFFEWFSCGVTLASLMLATLDRWIRGLEGKEIPELPLSVLVTLEYVFGWYFFIELCIKLHALRSWYWQRLSNCFDMLLCFSILGMEALSLWDPHAAEWISFLIILRSLRIVSLLGHFTRWRLMFSLLVRMVPATTPILAFQYFVCSMFAIIGVHLFGGLVYVENPVLEGTEYADSGLWVYNYNDYATAMVSAFNLCIVNNWYVIMDGITAATGTSWARAYFITFWAISVCFALNVVVAFFVGAFTIQLEKAKNDQSIVGHQTSAILARRKFGFSFLLGYNKHFSKYELYEDIVKG
ncbi:hypothetical protein R1sor_006721 [Riccia sorocarpa]|uniref:Ion transport domain-containing protein n=1 Tax=Riccia sorocarpa TaxID=122646 RepID=A0ABD3HS24_9MARC